MLELFFLLLPGRLHGLPVYRGSPLRQILFENGIETQSRRRTRLGRAQHPTRTSCCGIMALAVLIVAAAAQVGDPTVDWRCGDGSDTCARHPRGRAPPPPHWTQNYLSTPCSKCPRPPWTHRPPAGCRHCLARRELPDDSAGGSNSFRMAVSGRLFQLLGEEASRTPPHNGNAWLLAPASILVAAMALVAVAVGVAARARRRQRGPEML